MIGAMRAVSEQKKSKRPSNSAGAAIEPPRAAAADAAADAAAAAGTDPAVEPLAACRRDGGAAATPFPVVGIGASAGGLAAFEAFFGAMPSDDDNRHGIRGGAAPAPDHKSMLVDLIKRYTRMQVFEVERRHGGAAELHLHHPAQPRHGAV